MTAESLRQSFPQPIEIVDRQNRPIGVLPLPEVHKQMLLHRSVLILIFDAHGKLILQKRPSTRRFYPGRWDLTTGGHVPAGSSSLEAAQKMLQLHVAFRTTDIRLRKELPAGVGTGFEFISLYTGKISGETPHPEDLPDVFLCVDKTELTALVEGFREILTPRVVHCFEKDLIFPFIN